MYAWLIWHFPYAWNSSRYGFLHSKLYSPCKLLGAHTKIVPFHQTQKMPTFLFPVAIDSPCQIITESLKFRKRYLAWKESTHRIVYHSITKYWLYGCKLHRIVELLFHQLTPRIPHPLFAYWSGNRLVGSLWSKVLQERGGELPFEWCP